MASAGEKQPGSLSRLVFLVAGLRGGVMWGPDPGGSAPGGGRTWWGQGQPQVLPGSGWLEQSVGGGRNPEGGRRQVVPSQI